MPIPQSKRLLALSTPLGADTLVPWAFSGREAVSELFEYTIDMVSEEPALDPSRILGQRITLTLRHTGTAERYFNGIVRKLEQGMPHGIGLRNYRAVVVPELWLTTLRRDSRIFQDKSVKEIVKAVLADAGITPRIRAIGGQTVRGYCVQYDETDFNFISRLLEEEGLFYFFKHSKDGHEMFIGDATSHYEDCDEKEVTLTTTGHFQGAALASWEVGSALFSGKVTQRDYDYEAPAKDLKTEITTGKQPALLKKHEVYHYPGRYADRSVGTKLTDARIEALEATHQQYSGSGSSAGLYPGGKARLKGAIYKAPESSAFVCLEVEHSARDDSSLSQQAAPPSYSNRFRAMADSALFRPQRRATRELVRGPLTALVVGPSGEEIYCDKLGRIKVQFHWDRQGKKDENSGCWVRVAQMLAGKNWGSQFIPRIGMEVVVQFLHGDPDRPLVVGTVYNGENAPPYGLPANKTQSGLKTRSSPKGDGANFNELRFEDKKGEEQIYFHAEKDFERIVENDDALEVGNDQSIEVKKNRAKTITEGNETIAIKEGNRTTTLGKGNDTLKIDTGNRAATIAKGNDALTLDKGGRTVDLKGAGNHVLKLAQGNADVTLQSGNYTLKASAGKISIEAAQSIELKVGGTSLKLSPTGIEMKGPMVKIQADAKAEVKGALVDVSASGMLTLKGGLTKIN